jgi:predicted ATP-binding protein involved in virulence
MKYWLHRISHHSEVSYPLLEKNILTIGFSDFANQKFIDNILGAGESWQAKWDKLENELKGTWLEKQRTRHNLWRFIEGFKKNDWIIIPSRGTFYIYELVSEKPEPIGNLQIDKLKNWHGNELKIKDEKLYKDENLIDLGFYWKVKLIAKEIPRKLADDALKKKMRYGGTNLHISDVGKSILNALQISKGEVEVKQCIIDNVIIKNFYSIEKIELSNLKDKNFIFILGENGSGKTIFLKSLLIALNKEFIRKVASKEITGVIEDIFIQNKDFSYSSTAYRKLNNKNQKFKITDKQILENIYAYGTYRNRVSSDKPDQYGFMTLFKNDEFLINSEQWLKDTKFAELEAKEEKEETNITVLIIQKILRDILEIEDLEIEVSSQNVIFKVKGENFSLTQLSEGFKSAIIFVIDLIARLTENNPEITDLKDYQAVVLVDELDLFLHPMWEKNICDKLYRCFPNIQFFITTHSPILIDGAIKSKEIVDKTVIYRFENINNQSTLTQTYNGEDIKTWLPNILISSNLFDPEYIDEMPKDLILQARTEKSFSKMLKTDENIEKLRAKEEEIKKQYQELLKQNEND